MSAPRGVVVYLAATLLCLGLLIAVARASGAGSSWASALACVLTTGLWVSLGVMLMDLFLDVWPGFTSDEGLARASRYYVQIFEQWKNMAVLLAFMTVLSGAPLVVGLGYAPAPVLAFPVWIGTCIVFAMFFNQVLYPRGLVQSRLPLPVWVNEYSVARPLWAHFFAVIHLVMAAGLVAGLFALHGARP